MANNEFVCRSTDDFFETAANVFRELTIHGLVQLDVSNIMFQHGSVQKFFLECINTLKDGLFPEVLDTVLEWKMTLITNEKRLTSQEILELILLRKICMYYHIYNIESFLDMCNQMCSNGCYNKCELLLKNEI